MCVYCSKQCDASHPGVGSRSELNIYHLTRRGLVRVRAQQYVTSFSCIAHQYVLSCIVLHTRMYRLVLLLGEEKLGASICCTK